MRSKLSLNGCQPTLSSPGTRPVSRPGAQPRSAACRRRQFRTGAAESLLAAGLLTLLLGASGPVFADSERTYSIRVPVVESTPVVERRTMQQPERYCEPAPSVRRSSVSETYRRGYGYSGSDGRYDAGYDSRYDDQYLASDRVQRRGGVGAQIIGGLIGGAIGNQFGGGNGRKALTIAGALIGSSIARGGGREERVERRVYPQADARRSRATYEPDYVCRTSYRERVVEDIVGYDVRYSYNDVIHTRRMDYDPGDMLELQVRAVPEVLTDAHRNPASDRSVDPSVRTAAPTSFRRTL